MAKKKKRLTIMVSSTVYGIEELLDQVYALLGGFGYEVWMSHKGTVPVYPDQTALESCLTAVEKCDLFLSIITPRYGSGIVDGQLSITHQELLKSIELKQATLDSRPRPRGFCPHAVPEARGQGPARARGDAHDSSVSMMPSHSRRCGSGKS